LDEDILRLVNLDELIDEQVTSAELYQALRAELDSRTTRSARVSGLLEENLSTLAASLSLSELDCKVLCLIVHYEEQKGLREVFDLASTCPGQNQMVRLISVALDESVTAIRRALAAHGPLRQS